MKTSKIVKFIVFALLNVNVEFVVLFIVLFNMNTEYFPFAITTIRFDKIK